MLMRDAGVRLAWVVRRSTNGARNAATEALCLDNDDPVVVHTARDTSARELLDASPVDVVLDFSSDSGLDYYGAAAAAQGTAIVTAISRYSDAKQGELRSLAGRTAIVWSPNITVGINFMMLAAQALQRIAPQADIQIVEEHFRDKPETSGTALRLARGLGVPEGEVHVIRAGGIVGVHEILMGFPTQTIRLRHEAISREAFGHGAVFAARQLIGRPPGLYRMEDLLLPYFSLEQDASRAAAPLGARSRLASRLRNIAGRLDRVPS